MRSSILHFLSFSPTVFLQKIESSSNLLPTNYDYQLSHGLSFDLWNSPSSVSSHIFCHNLNLKALPNWNDLDYSIPTISANNEITSLLLSFTSNGSSNIRIFEKNIFFLMAALGTIVLVLEVLINDIRQLRQTKRFSLKDNEENVSNDQNSPNRDID